MHSVHEQKTAAQFDRWARWYDAILGRFYFRWVYQKSIALGESLLSKELFENPVIVDLACGSGAMLARMRNIFTKATLHGIDMSPGMLRHARARLGGDANIRLHETSARKIPLASHSVHLLFCVDAFHHFDEPQAVIAEIARVLHPGGIIILFDPAVETATQKIIFRVIGKLVDHPFHFYTLCEITKLFAATKLTASHNGVFLLNNILIIRPDQK